MINFQIVEMGVPGNNLLQQLPHEGMFHALSICCTEIVPLSVPPPHGTFRKRNDWALITLRSEVSTDKGFVEHVSTMLAVNSGLSQKFSLTPSR